LYSADRILASLLARRVVIVLGKGGVGKTTIGAALACYASRTGARVLAMETDIRAPMAATFGCEARFEPTEVLPNLSLMVLEGQHCLEEYLRLVVSSRPILKAVFTSRLYQHFVQAAPGLRELMMLGKVRYEAQRLSSSGRAWDWIVVDGPASGQALSLLRMPFYAHQTFGQSVVGREASNISRMLCDERTCALVQVTTSEPLAMAETLQTQQALSDLGISVGCIFFNRWRPRSFGYRDVARLAKLNSVRHAERLANLARAQLERIATARQALRVLRERGRAAIIELPEHRLSGAELVERLTYELGRLSHERDNIGMRPALSH
jgi:hypothetical protein